MLEAHGRGTLILRSWQDPDRDAVVLEVSDDGPGVPEDVQIEDFRSVLHDEGRRQGHGPRADGRVRDRAGARRPAVGGLLAGPGRVVLARAAGERRERPPARAAARANACPTCRRARARWSSKTSRRWARPSRPRWPTKGSGPIVRRTAKRRSPASRERHYDVIICDLKMPKVDGMAFFREVSAKMPHVARRLIFVTGDVAGTEAERFLEESGCRWVPKPFRLAGPGAGRAGNAGLAPYGHVALCERRARRLTWSTRRRGDRRRCASCDA